jgi:CofD-related protein of GAK system
LARYARTPELGPKVLFFSGGSALAASSRRLIDYTHNSIHLITPFDSGGSSAVLRNAFGMPAVGDIRNRLMALADQSVKGAHDIYTLFAHRLSVDASPEALRTRLDEMIEGVDPLVAAVSDPMRKIIRNHLRMFRDEAPDSFSLAGASVGNLIMTGGFLNHGRHLDPVVYLFAKLVESRGVVRPVVNADLSLAAINVDGAITVGQHLITGGEAGVIADVFLTDVPDGSRYVSAPIRKKIRQLIAEAELICFPMGSFYTSVVASLLPEGIAEAVAGNDCPKVYIPNTGHDPEQAGKTLTELVAALNEKIGGRLDFVLVDDATAPYPGGVDRAALARQGVETVDLRLVGDDPPMIDPDRLVTTLLSLV